MLVSCAVGAAAEMLGLDIWFEDSQIASLSAEKSSIEPVGDGLGFP